MKTRMKIIMLTLVLALVLVGCGDRKLEKELDGRFPLKIVDDSGREIEIKERPKRIVSLSKNNTEILFKLGLGDKVVGVTKFCDYPEEALSKEKIRDLDSIDIDKIIELEADLVIEYGRGTSQARKDLESKGITVLSFAPETIEEVAKTIADIGVATASDSGKEVEQDILSRYKSIKENRGKNKDVKVFYEEWKNPLLTAGKGTMVDYLITEAGGVNIARKKGKGYPEYNLEELEKEDVDLYIAKEENNKSIEDIKNSKGFKKIKAVKNNNILLLDGSGMEVQGPRLIDNLESIYNMIEKTK